MDNKRLEVVYNDTAVPGRLTVAKDRVTIKVNAAREDREQIVETLKNIASKVAKDDRVRVTMRGCIRNSSIEMYDDSKKFSIKYDL